VRFLNGQCGALYLRARRAAASKKAGDITAADLYVDIGARDEAEAQTLCPLGSVCLFDAPLRSLGGGRISGPYMDDLICCVALLLAMEQIKESPNDLYFVFAAQEEVGLRGALTASYGVAPDVGFACDVFPVGDTPSTPPPRPDTRLGAGPGIKLMDGSAICTPWVVRHIRETALRFDIPFQMEAYASGGTDAGAIQKAHGGVPVGGIGIATRHTHSPVETCDESDVLHAAQLIAAIAGEPLPVPPG
jgi:endoglucanase